MEDFNTDESNIHIKDFRKSHRRCSVRKGALRNFVKFTGKPARASFLIKKTNLNNNLIVCIPEHFCKPKAIFFQRNFKIGTIPRLVI